MTRPEFIRHSCYKFMLQLCIIDMIVIPNNAIISGLQTIYGLHFCTHPNIFYISGALGGSGWYVGSVTCVMLALDRFFEMTWPKGAVFLFKGRRFFLWTTFSVAYLLFTFTQLPAVLNTKYYAWFFDPFYGTPKLEASPQFLDITFHTINNISVVVLLGSIYVSLCILYTTRFKSKLHVKVSRHQKLLTIQALCICIEFFIAAIIYVYMQFFHVSEFIVVLGHVCWILMHGDTPIVYIILNKSLRKAILQMFHLKTAVVSTNENIYQMNNSNNNRNSIPNYQ